MGIGNDDTLFLSWESDFESPVQLGWTEPLVSEGDRFADELLSTPISTGGRFTCSVPIDGFGSGSLFKSMHHIQVLIHDRTDGHTFQ